MSDARDDAEPGETGGEEVELDEAMVPLDPFDWGAELQEEPAEEEPDVLRFDIGGRAFAMFADHVAEVTSKLDVTPIPTLPPYVYGVAVRRRHVVAVVDLAVFLGLADSRSVQPSRFLIVESGSLQIAVGVHGVAGLEIWPEDAESATLMQNTEEQLREFALGARWAPGGVVLLLDAAKILERAAVR